MTRKEGIAMKDKYEALEMEVIVFDARDIIVASRETNETEMLPLSQ